MSAAGLMRLTGSWSALIHQHLRIAGQRSLTGSRRLGSSISRMAGLETLCRRLRAPTLNRRCGGRSARGIVSRSRSQTQCFHLSSATPYAGSCSQAPRG